MHSSDMPDHAAVHLAKHLVAARPCDLDAAPVNEVGAIHGQRDAFIPIWRTRDYLEARDILEQEITKEAMISGQAMMAMQPVGSSPCLGSGAIPMPHKPTTKEALDQRIYATGYNMQELERIRREVKELGLEKAEHLINEAIEMMAAQWLFDRQSYRKLP